MTESAEYGKELLVMPVEEGYACAYRDAASGPVTGLALKKIPEKPGSRTVLVKRRVALQSLTVLDQGGAKPVVVEATKDPERESHEHGYVIKIVDTSSPSQDEGNYVDGPDGRLAVLASSPEQAIAKTEVLKALAEMPDQVPGVYSEARQYRATDIVPTAEGYMTPDGELLGVAIGHFDVEQNGRPIITMCDHNRPGSGVRTEIIVRKLSLTRAYIPVVIRAISTGPKSFSIRLVDTSTSSSDDPNVYILTGPDGQDLIIQANSPAQATVAKEILEALAANPAQVPGVKKIEEVIRAEEIRQKNWERDQELGRGLLPEDATIGPFKTPEAEDWKRWKPNTPPPKTLLGKGDAFRPRRDSTAN